MAWMSSTEAAERLRQFRQLCPGNTAGLAMLTLHADPATYPLDWQPVQITSWVNGTEPLELVG